MARIYKKQGSWAFRVYYKDESGKQRTINRQGFKRKSDAVNMANQIEVKKLTTKIDKAETITFTDFFEEWIKTFKVGRYSPSTDNKYKIALSFIKEYFNDTLLKDVTKISYQKFIDKYSEDHVKDSIYRINGYIRSCLKEALDQNIIHTDFTRNIVITTYKKSKDDNLKYLEYNETSELKKMAREKASIDNISAFEILFAIGTGCRYAEIVGLTWDNVDFDNNVVSIKKTYDYKNRNGFLPTKTKSSVRDITISPELTHQLRLLKLQQNKLFLLQGYTNTKKFVFINSQHNVPSDNAANKVLRSYVKKIYRSEGKNIPKKMSDLIGFHGLRHTHASILISKGLSIEYIAQRLGHSNVAITSKVYIHLLKDYRKLEDEKAIKTLNDL